MKPALTRFPGVNEVIMSLYFDYFVLLEPRGLDPDLIHAFFILFSLVVEDFVCLVLEFSSHNPLPC